MDQIDIDGRSCATSASPTSVWVAFAIALVLACAIAIATLLLSIGRDIGCSMEADCGTGAWLGLLVALAIAAFVVPIGTVVGARSRRLPTRGVCTAMLAPAVAWVAAFVVIAG